MAFWLSPKLAGLRWIDADLAGARLSPRRPRVAVNYVVHESEPKTRMGKRALALDPATVAALQEHKARQEQERADVGSAWMDSGLVFTRPDGSPIHPDLITDHTTIVGNLVDDPELRFTNTGTAVANMRVAVTQRIQQDGTWRDGDTSFLRVNVWRGQAEHLADSLAKGDRVMVTGRLRQRSWETPHGDQRSVTEIQADKVGASLKWATAKVERASQRGNGERTQGRERQAERGGDFDDAPPF